MSKKSTTPKSPAKNAKGSRKPAKAGKTTTFDAGGGVLVDVVQPKPAKGAKAKKSVEPKAKKVSGLDAAYEVLKAKGEPMTCQAIVDEMLAKGMWKTSGKTPAATIYSAILREIDGKPGESRFAKTGRGLFASVASKKS